MPPVCIQHIFQGFNEAATDKGRVLLLLEGSIGAAGRPNAAVYQHKMPGPITKQSLQSVCCGSELGS